MTILSNEKLQRGFHRSLSVTKSFLPSKYDTYNLEIFRTMNLINVVVKILQKIIRNSFKHPKENRILSEKQHGFETDCSCLTNLSIVCERWCALKCLKLRIDVAYIAFSKAFDESLYNQINDFLVEHQKWHSLTSGCLTGKLYLAELQCRSFCNYITFLVSYHHRFR